MSSFLFSQLQQGFCGIINSDVTLNITEAPIGASTAHSPLPADLSSLLAFLFSFSALRDWLKLIAVGGVLESCRRLFYTGYNKLVNSFFISASFAEDDDSYDWMMVWLSKQTSWVEARELQISTKSFGLNTSAVLVPGEEEDASSLVQGSRRLAYMPSISTTQSICILTRHHRFLNHLLLDAKKEYMAAQEHSISIYVSDSHNDWRHVASRPKRPLHSIVLDPGIKDRLIDDARDFLASKPWYTTRGIPFRRGYLLYGAPGSGKTSIIHSLAGELGLDVYIVSLSRIGMDDTTLSQLISDLPEKCIALMEDIDAAFTQSVNRDEPSDPQELSDPSKPREPHKLGSRVSLSGLLNALDGVGAQEGRILFATTNKYECLDPALCRPGRMDLHIEFKLASKFQARQLYRNFYLPVGEDDEDEDDISKTDDYMSAETETLIETASESSETSNIIVPDLPHCLTSKRSTISSDVVFHQQGPNLSRPQILHLATLFADSIPDRQLSMASLQGYLMGYKTRPHNAVEDIASWVKSECPP
ncbi:hypothetical protein H0H81_001666 [Sphagnurus paluster]|uniref:P-loop containing nucleoside triphosphate hydrolase protein n=1 Tax=Sphagnurus paluster TaxID=117069 RepID=A0A9P7FT71_9AGAR|nr:hypothetical protein H0H81_001666 [Sphagnurus paluster]